jgi:predicted flap endonuclease-1-like 5' DNA nuclease
MSPDLNAYLPLILLGLVALVLGAWVLARMSRKAKVVQDDSTPPLSRDVLDEGAAPAQRNQALIDAAPAAVKPEPVAPAPVPVPAATPEAEQAPAGADDLTRIKGLGPKLVTLLGELGISTYSQIAGWSDSDVERIDAQLGRFSGRITRDQWVEQAKLLLTGDESAYVARFGKNG